MDIALESFNYDAIDEGLDIKAKFKKIFKAIIDKIKSVLTKCAEAIRKLRSKHDNKKTEPDPAPQSKSTETSHEEKTDDEIMDIILTYPFHIRKYSSVVMDEAIASVNKQAKSIIIRNAYPTITDQYLEDICSFIWKFNGRFFDDVFGIKIDALKQAEDPIALLWDRLSGVTKHLSVLGIGEMQDDQFMSRLQELANTDNEHTLDECLTCDIYRDTIDKLHEHKFRMHTADAAIGVALMAHNITDEDLMQNDMKKIEAGAAKFAKLLDKESVEAVDTIIQVLDKWCAMVAVMGTYYVKIVSSIKTVGMTYTKLVNDNIMELMKHDKDARHRIAEMYRSNPVKESASFCSIR